MSNPGRFPEGIALTQGTVFMVPDADQVLDIVTEKNLRTNLARREISFI
jgi:hypothetical protein